ncbi:Uncharacterised protein [Citrobacter koseri]|uniref:Uncharacterized protein n=1 Tax=Citrobacter koseri TaxID=545 RepID=A0A2X2VUU8_CITKO|nr:Uncharacterised protein [Citrobacter koseri]
MEILFHRGPKPAWMSFSCPALLWRKVKSRRWPPYRNKESARKTRGQVSSAGKWPISCCKKSPPGFGSSRHHPLLNQTKQDLRILRRYHQRRSRHRRQLFVIQFYSFMPAVNGIFTSCRRPPTVPAPPGRYRKRSYPERNVSQVTLSKKEPTVTG